MKQKRYVRVKNLLCYMMAVLISGVLYSCQSDEKSAFQAPTIMILNDSLVISSSRLASWDRVGIDASAAEGIFSPMRGVLEQHFKNDSTIRIAVSELVRFADFKFPSLPSGSTPPQLFLSIRSDDGFDTTVSYLLEGLSPHDLSKIDLPDDHQDRISRYVVYPDSVRESHLEVIYHRIKEQQKSIPDSGAVRRLPFPENVAIHVAPNPFYAESELHINLAIEQDYVGKLLIIDREGAIISKLDSGLFRADIHDYRYLPGKDLENGRYLVILVNPDSTIVDYHEIVYSRDPPAQSFRADTSMLNLN